MRLLPVATKLASNRAIERQAKIPFLDIYTAGARAPGKFFHEPYDRFVKVIFGLQRSCGAHIIDL